MLTLVIVTVLSITGATVVYFSSTHARSADYAADDARALQFAEAGLNHARSALFASPDASHPGAVGNGNFMLEAATITFSGSLSGTIWTLTGSAAVPNPTGPTAAPITQTVTSQVEIVTALDSDSTAWAYFFGDCDQTLVWSKSGKKIEDGTVCGDLTTSKSGKKVYPGGCTVPS